MLGVHQYRQRLPEGPVFNTDTGQVALDTSSVNRGERSFPEAGNAVNSGEPISSGEIISSLAGLRETLQAEPMPERQASDHSTPFPTDLVELEKKVVDSANTHQSMPIGVLEESPSSVIAQSVHIPQVTHPPQATQENAPEPISEIIQGPIEAQEKISFTLACWQVSDTVLVINGFAYGEQANRTQLELLANILRAIGQLPQGLPAAELIEWPLSPGAESTLAGAKTQLSMFLLGRQQVRPFRRLLAMGDAPQRLLANDIAVNDSALSLVETLFIPSLQAMLAEPLCKREAWQALRHLRAD